MAPRTCVRVVKGVEGEVVSPFCQRGLVSSSMAWRHMRRGQRLPLLAPTTHNLGHLAGRHGEAAGLVVGVGRIRTQVDVMDDLVDAVLVRIVVDVDRRAIPPDLVLGVNAVCGRCDCWVEMGD